jgi:P-type Ca2+ transporter type 2C
MSKKKDVKTTSHESDTDGAAAPRFPYHASSIEECLADLRCSSSVVDKGLTVVEAAERLETYGPNRLTEKEKVTLLQRIWNQVANVLVGVLVFVALVSLVRVFTVEGVDNIVSNAIQVGLIVFVIT